ncbi:MAG: vWA domain-containing protein, partial [Planctomycetia bacterium]
MALVAVPFVLHLIMRRKPVKREFPALRFLRQRAVANRRRLRLNHLLLLFLRMAALTLLAFALARPVLRGAGWLADGEGPVAAAFVFDTAPRMLLREGNRTRLEQAVAMARTLFQKLPAESKVAVLDTAGGAAAFSPTVAAAAARIDRLAAATPTATLSQTVAGALRLLAGSGMVRREIYLFTDCSHGAWDNAQSLDLAAHPDTSLLVVDVGATNVRNYAIEAVELSSDRISAGAPLGLTVTTSRVGTDAGRSVSVEMVGADGRSTRRAMKPGAWKENSQGQLDFEIAGLEPGIRQGRVVIDGADDLEADNSQSFTVEVGAAARVLVVAPAPATQTGLFVSQAIAPVALAKAGKAAFDVTLADTAELASIAWDDFRGIVLVDPSPLPPATWDLLGQWVAAGRGLVVWLGPRAGEAAKFNSAASQRVLGGGIVRVWRAAGGENFLAPEALDHPLLAAFRRVGDAVPWQDFPVTRHWEFEADEGAAAPAGGAADATADVVAAYRNGLPAVIEHRLGQGMVVAVTTPVSQSADDPDAWNTLATGFEPWPFVMLANETLLRAIDTADDLNIVAGRPASLHVSRRDAAAAFVRPPEGDEFPVAIDQARGTVAVSATQLPGNYAVRVGGAAGGAATGFSANLDPSATDFWRLDADGLAAVWGTDARLARTEAELVRDVNLERVGAELFGWIILLAAAVMAADWIVANRFYTPREESVVGAGPAAEFAEAAAEAAAPADAAADAAGSRRPPPVPDRATTAARKPPPLPDAVEQEAGA